MQDQLFYDPKRSEWRTLTWTEVAEMRPDELAINVRDKIIFVNEMTRAWDSDPTYAAKKDSFKSACYAPWVGHLHLALFRHGWQIQQLNFTVGARSSIPESEWHHHLDLYDVHPGKRDGLFQDLVGILLQGGVEVCQVYKTHQQERHAQARGQP